MQVRTEHKLITQGFMGCTIFLIAYVVIICYWVATDKQYSENTSELQFFVLGTLALVVRGLCMFCTWRVLKNFDKGLRQVKYNVDVVFVCILDMKWFVLCFVFPFSILIKVVIILIFGVNQINNYFQVVVMVLIQRIKLQEKYLQIQEIMVVE